MFIKPYKINGMIQKTRDQLVVQPAINFLAPEKMKGLEVGSDGFGQVLGGYMAKFLRRVDSFYWRIFFQTCSHDIGP